ncbi:hypothetical protein [Methanomassiliicoccus luminyensis]|jgi:hypothetical protein|uniref:hypothetical protein n=1 Tax=Methanomassiliicoccus luminyensis TaxID=1080712 RepID=UPI00037D19C9|nr:hypothetical protein [Methanomassiliicoccus luminyensis]
MKVKEIKGGQKTLFNFDIGDPFEAPSMDVFKDQFRRLHGRNPSASDISAYYDRHPKELERVPGRTGKR